MPTAAPQSKFMRKCKNITQNNRICYIFELNYYKKSVAKLFRVLQHPFLQIPVCKLQRDRTAGAFANAGTAFDAFVFGDFGLTVNDFDRFDRAGSHADAATGASGAINFSSHFLFSLRIFRLFLLADRIAYPINNLPINITQ